MTRPDPPAPPEPPEPPELPTLIRPIAEAEQPSRGWIVHLDGRPVEHVHSLTIHHPRFGLLAYGQTAGGHDGWSFREIGGGGVVVLPFVQLAAGVHVGLVRQHRHNQGGEVWNAPRGFVDPGEDHLVAGSRELGEETGLDPRAHRVVLLPGEPANPNSAFFETPDPSLGTRFAAVELAPSDLVDRDGALQLRDAIIASSPDARAHRLTEQISSACFVHWTEAARLSDMFTNAAVARLLAHLHVARPPRLELAAERSR